MDLREVRWWTLETSEPFGKAAWQHSSIHNKAAWVRGTRKADMPNSVTRCKVTPIQYLSGVRLGADPRMETKKTRVQKGLDNMLKM